MRYRGIRFANDREIGIARAKVKNFIPVVGNDMRVNGCSRALGRYEGIIKLLDEGKLKQAAYAAKVATQDFIEHIETLEKDLRVAKEIASLTDAISR